MVMFLMLQSKENGRIFHILHDTKRATIGKHASKHGVTVLEEIKIQNNWHRVATKYVTESDKIRLIAGKYMRLLNIVYLHFCANYDK